MLLVRWVVLFLLMVSALLFAAFIATGETRYRVWGWKVLRVTMGAALVFFAVLILERV
jgi:hypothetical protein